jgi:hypothetical protein
MGKHRDQLDPILWKQHPKRDQLYVRMETEKTPSDHAYCFQCMKQVIASKPSSISTASIEEHRWAWFGNTRNHHCQPKQVRGSSSTSSSVSSISEAPKIEISEVVLPESRGLTWLQVSNAVVSECKSMGKDVSDMFDEAEEEDVQNILAVAVLNSQKSTDSVSIDELEVVERQLGAANREMLGMRKAMKDMQEGVREISQERVIFQNQLHCLKKGLGLAGYSMEDIDRFMERGRTNK